MTQIPRQEFGSLAGKRAVVTGASSGIGRAIAAELARGGADVLIHFARPSSMERVQELKAELAATGTSIQMLRFPFHGEADYAEFLRQVHEVLPDPDLWVNNAGVDLLTGDGPTLSYADKLRLLWDVDVRSTMLLTKLVGQQMKERGRGAILNIGWDQADRGMEGDSGELFSAAKNAIMGATRSFALSLAPEVRVNCIAPGWIKTAWGEQAGPVWQQRVVQETPLKRWGLPEDIARLARFLLSDDADYLTGQVINANGGAVR